MQSLNRIRIVIFALMVFGAFANFAQNEWGHIVIVICQGFIALTFLGETVAYLIQRVKAKQSKVLSALIFATFCIMFVSYFTGWIINSDSYSQYFIIITLFALLLLLLLLIIDEIVIWSKRNKIPSVIKGIYEAFFFGMVFLGLMSKNLLLPGSGVVIVLSIVALVPYFIVKMIRFFVSNYKKGFAIVSLLSIGTTATILMGAAYMFKVMHWPGSNIMFYIVLIFTAIMLLATIKWKYEFENKKINVLKAMQMLNKNILLFYFVSLAFGVYYQLASVGIAPKFYSQRLPSEVNKYIDEREDEKAEELRNAYVNFIERAEKNGFLK